MYAHTKMKVARFLRACVRVSVRVSVVLLSIDPAISQNNERMQGAVQQFLNRDRTCLDCSCTGQPAGLDWLRSQSIYFLSVSWVWSPLLPPPLRACVGMHVRRRTQRGCGVRTDGEMVGAVRTVRTIPYRTHHRAIRQPGAGRARAGSRAGSSVMSCRVVVLGGGRPIRVQG
jgi:hypothetical protein